MKTLKGRKSLETKEITIVNEVARVLSRTLDFEEAVRDILKVLYSFWDVNLSFVAIFNRELKALQIVKAFGFSEEEIKRGIFKKGEGITGKVFKSGIPVVLTDVLSNPAFLNKTKIGSKLTGNETFISVPIKVGGDIVGTLSVFKTFSSRESVESGIETLMILGTLIGMFYRLSERVEEERLEWEEEKRALREELKKNYSIHGIVGQSDAILNLVELVKKAAATDSTILITGESGTGKSLIAKAIHFLSRRKDKPFITINCAAIPETLLEAELFGYERGAFTGAQSPKKGKFELADGGTVFLDEIGDMPLTLQAKILRVLQDREIEKLGGEKTIRVDVRIIAATNKNLHTLVNEGKFREDLYYRLNVVPVHVPPLRERKEDIPLLLEHFLQTYNSRYGKKVRLSPDAVEALVEYNWPGNIRELENAVERLVVMHDGTVRSQDLPPHILAYRRRTALEGLSNLPDRLQASEREKIIEALETTGYVKSRAAKLLGYTLRQLDYRIKKYGIEIKKF
ncbi:sigma-54 interaction domain-containing protein [Hydrogenivirga caldilitoris]|nr:sigma 54-interacting transcriptional regulator [Hydrogenivirga caldilitoris]